MYNLSFMCGLCAKYVWYVSRVLRNFTSLVTSSRGIGLRDTNVKCHSQISREAILEMRYNGATPKDAFG